MLVEVQETSTGRPTFNGIFCPGDNDVLTEIVSILEDSNIRVCLTWRLLFHS